MTPPTTPVPDKSHLGFPDAFWLSDNLSTFVP